MINRKVSAPLSSVDRSDSGISSSSAQVKSRPQPKPRMSLNTNNHHGSPPPPTSVKPSQHHLKESSHLSISQLVDSGMSALHDGNGNNDDDDDLDLDLKGNNNHKKFRRKESERIGPPTAKMSPLQMYILEQAKLSGYRLRGGDALNGDRDSYVESEDDRGGESDAFADDEVRTLTCLCHILLYKGDLSCFIKNYQSH